MTALPPAQPRGRRNGPPAVVLGLSMNALGTVRALRHAGRDVVAFEERPTSPTAILTWMSSRTRACRRNWLPPGAGEEAWVEAMLEFGRGQEERCPVLPSSDAHVDWLSRHRARLEPWFRFFIPDPETLLTLTDKDRFGQHAESVGVPVPACVRLSPGFEAPSLPATMRFPCILKPVIRDSRWDDLFSPAKALELLTPADFEAGYRSASRAGVDLLLQETIPGPDRSLAFSHLYLAGAGRLAGAWTGRKLRQLPIHFGTATLAETEDLPEVLDLSLRLLAPLRYRGYASVEFKHDARDGSYRALEITAGRSWYNHVLGADAGVNLPALWYSDLMGEPPPETVAVARVGVRWVDEYRDLIAASEYRRAGELGWWKWLGSYWRVRSFAAWSWRDPLPGLFVVARLGLSVINAVRRTLTGRRP